MPKQNVPDFNRLITMPSEYSLDVMTKIRLSEIFNEVHPDRAGADFCNPLEVLLLVGIRPSELIALNLKTTHPGTW